jgi:Inhibitor of the KinA pathway to sporulation, predicted exonuclease
MSRNFLVLDFEFTHYSSPVGKPRGFFSEIIEIGAVKYSGESLDITDRLSEYVKPHFYPNHAKEGLDFSMISAKDLKDAIEFAVMLDKLRELYIPHETYFTTWGESDFEVLAEGCKRHGLENPVLFEDCLDMAAWYKWEMGDSYTTGLRQAIEEQCVPTEAMMWHTACDDAENTGLLLMTLLNEGWNPDDFLQKDSASET